MSESILASKVQKSIYEMHRMLTSRRCQSTAGCVQMCVDAKSGFFADILYDLILTQMEYQTNINIFNMSGICKVSDPCLLLVLPTTPKSAITVACLSLQEVEIGR